MPQAIAGAIVAAIGATGALATVLTAVIALGITMGINALIGAVFGKGAPKPSDGQQVVRQSVASRTRNYGIVHTGGLQSFFESRGGTLGQAVTLGTGEEGAVIEHRLNNKVVTLDGSGVVTDASYHGAVSVITRNGAADQTAISELTAAFPEWTSDHRQRGCAHAAVIARPVKQEQFSEVYNSQYPQYTQVRHGVKIYDPRLDSTAVIFDDGAGFTVNGTGPQRIGDPTTWETSDNAALVIGDYLAHPDGYGIGWSNVNWTNVAIEAAHANETVTTVGEETIARWRLWASYRLANDERRAVLANMLKAVDGFCWQGADGRFNLQLGRWEEPALVLTDDHILGLSAQLGPPAQQRVSALKVLYTEAAIGYREQESATIGTGPDGEDPNTAPQTMEAYYAPHHNQAARVGKINWARLGDERWRITAQLNLFGLNLIGERFCRLESAALGVAGWFAVDGQLALDIARQRVSASLVQVDPADWDFDAASEEGTPPAAAESSGGGAGTIDAMAGLSVSVEPVSIGGGATGVALRASWTASGRADLIAQVQYKESEASEWLEMTVSQAALLASSGVVSAGTSYDVRGRFVTIWRRAGPWTTEVAAASPAETAIVYDGGDAST